MDIRELRPADEAEHLRLIEDFGLEMLENSDFGLGIFDKNRLLGCCSLKNGLIQGLAVDRAHQGEGLAAILVGELIKAAAARGVRQLSVITKPEAANQFVALGFRLIASAPPHAAFLEFGSGGIADCLIGLKRAAEGKPTPRAALVMNCNPFTLGHRYLIERACRESAWVFVLAVEENLSEFPFDARLWLIREGTAHLPNLSVIPGGRYVVSSFTFPSYFTKREDLASAQGAMDAALFAGVIAPALGVTRRYVGSEPLSPVTHQYNQALRARLPREGVELIELPRLTHGGQPISASLVRAAIQKSDWDTVRALVPESTYAYLLSDEAKPVIERLMGERA